MKFGTGLLLCGVLLIAAAPAWGDRAIDPGAGSESASHGFSAKGAGSSSVELSSLGTSGIGMQSGNASGVESFGIGFSPRPNWKAWSRVRGEGVIATTAIAEPGSLELILLGVACVGLLSRRRGRLPVTI